MNNAWWRDQYYPQQQERRIKTALMAFHAFAILFVVLVIAQCAALSDHNDEAAVNQTLTREQRQEIVGRWQHTVFPGVSR